MKLLKRAAVHIIRFQVRHCAATPKIIINFGRTFSEQVAQLNFGNEKCIPYLFDCKPPLTIKDNRGRLTFFSWAYRKV